ncbi:MAG: hypothetical protein ACR2JF_00460 [Iamia sp.]
MEVVVGPVKAESMAAFAAFGSERLHAAGPGADVPSDAAQAFDGYLAEWADLGQQGSEDVTWSTSADPEVVEYLVYSFFRLTKQINEAAGRQSVVPEAAGPFYWLLVGGLLDALEVEGGSRAEFAAHLREFWPGDHEIP